MKKITGILIIIVCLALLAGCSPSQPVPQSQFTISNELSISIKDAWWCGVSFGFIGFDSITKEVLPGTGNLYIKFIDQWYRVDAEITIGPGESITYEIDGAVILFEVDGPE